MTSLPGGCRIAYQVVGEVWIMEHVKFVCPHCGYEAGGVGSCPECQAALVATCAACGNPVVGEHVHPED